MSKVWSNRFDDSLDPFIQKFNSSIEFDKELIIEDLEGSIAHARMLGKMNVITLLESQKIIEALNEI